MSPSLSKLTKPELALLKSLRSKIYSPEQLADAIHQLDLTDSHSIYGYHLDKMIRQLCQYEYFVSPHLLFIIFTK
jgi:hypothetical protein